MGHYSRETLGLYERAWIIGQRPEALLHLCLFRHELGYRPPADWLRQLASVSAKLSTSDRRRADTMRSLRQRSLNLASVKQFSDWLNSADRQQIAIVGNGAGVLGTRQKERIESAGCVVRFNHWQAPAADVGRRTDLWIRSPLDMRDRNSPAPTPPPAWIAVSGPEMISRRPEWPQWSAENSAPLLAIPLQVWRPLVRELQAPPSAGLLALHWLRCVRGTWKGIVAYGIGYTGGRYHAAKPRHRPSHRHRWDRELAMLERWTTEGLELNRS